MDYLFLNRNAPSKITKKNGFAEIDLCNRYRQKIGVAIIDTEDVFKVCEFRWHFGVDNCVQTRIGEKQSKLEHYILGTPSLGMVIDHKNRIPFDCRKDNLRFVTQGYNMQNRRNLGKTSNYRGVYYLKAAKRWHARISYKYIRYHLGHFKFEVDAAKAYNVAASKFYGEGAALNDV